MPHTQHTHTQERNHILHTDQSSFRPKHSTLDALLKATDNWRQVLDSNELVGAVFIDLSKAFDSIDHELLLSKLRRLINAQSASMPMTLHYITLAGMVLS